MAERFGKDIDAQVDRHYAQVESLYKDIHANPELAFEEVKTAKKLARELRDLGFEVTEGVGKTGVVARGVAAWLLRAVMRAVGMAA